MQYSDTAAAAANNIMSSLDAITAAVDFAGLVDAAGAVAVALIDAVALADVDELCTSSSASMSLQQRRLCAPLRS